MGLFGKGGGKPAEDPLALIQAGKFLEAIPLLQAKLKREPHDVLSRRRLAEAYEGAGRGKDAAAIYRLEGESCLASGDRPKGIAFLKKAAKVDPSDASIQTRIDDLEGRGASAGDDNFSFDMGEEEPAATVPMAAAPAHEPPPAVPAKQEEPEETGFSMGATSPPPAPPVAAEEEVAVAVEVEPEVEVEVAPPASVVEEISPEVPAEPELEPLPELLEELPIAETPPSEEAAIDPFAIEGVDPLPQEPGFQATRAAESDEVGLMLGAFPGLDAMDVMELIACFGCMTLQEGEVLIREGEAGEAVYLVIRGKLVARATLDGQLVELATLTRGDVLGEVSFLHHVPRTATVTALESTVVLEMPGASAKEQLAAMPHIKDRLEALIAERVDHTVALVKERMRHHPQG